MSNEQKKTVQFGLRLSPDEARMVREMCEARADHWPRPSAGDIVRRAIVEMYQRQHQDEAPAPEPAPRPRRLVDHLKQ